MVRTEQEIREYLKELQEVYEKAASPSDAGRKPAHLVALASIIRAKIDLLKWVLGVGNQT
ncbi:MAG: hypothetical protein ABSD79_03685 [Dehalococcoidales bacterium]|jgi:hypothetical protein